MRLQEAEEQREARQQQDREHHRQMRLQEAEQREARQQQDREHHSAKIIK